MIDISDPAAPTEVGSFDTPDDAQGVVVSGDLALVADNRAGLRVIDISDPAAPVEVGFLDTPSFARGVAVSGDLALVANLSAGLTIVRLPVLTAVPECKGLKATHVGTEAGETITGTPGDDTIRGEGGNDTICAGAGNDLVPTGKTCPPPATVRRR